ncbi:hypothetical protein [Phenylobacterium kunshanense]|uniref:Lipoprotein n=1 Tax=Phenylobacterium kunshanense TaxID=1445034 RepID=A0A328B830_9CAUL|nr:hypothetical protein [Phenylobacterium kunshanense]RAK63009.1 hypothetical protein DJ019_17180 [Phenylobacterium kunshanense]
MRGLLCGLAMLGLSGCGTLSTIAGASGGSDNAEMLRALGAHLDGCDRHYQGGLGVGASFTFTIDCKAQASIPPET